MLSRTVRRALPAWSIVQVNNANGLASHAHESAVWLVNRVLDGRFPAGSGVDLIREAAGSGPALLLVSNLDTAQAAARDAGAHPGFGKSDLYREDTDERLRAAARVVAS